MVNWIKLLYVLVITLLYVPMVFLGANVFFPEYTGSDSYFRGYEKCGGPRFSPVEAPEQREMDQEAYEKCMEDNRAQEKAWNDARAEYNGMKYAAITGFNLLILLIIIFITLADAVTMGIFFGTVVTAFGATVSYWEYARTKMGFILMLITFFVVLFVVNKRARTLIEKKPKKRK